MNVALIVVATVIGLPGLMAALHLTVLAVASLSYRQPDPPAPIPPRRFLAVIPAHNEEDVLSQTLSAIHRAQRARDQVLVIADRCTDQTVAIAKAFGAHVVERPPDARPGRAAARQDAVDYARRLRNWDVMVMIDADSEVEPGFFDVCEGMLATGARALQVRSEARPARGFFGQAGVAAFALQGILIPRGRDRLRLSVRLKGSGLVLVREVIESHRFRGPGASEDLWLSLDLCCEGIFPRHVDSTRLHSETARSLRAASVQRLRWEAGRLLAARQFVFPLLRRHDAASLEATLHLITPPLAMAVLSLVCSASLLLAGGSLGGSLIPTALLGLLAFDVTAGLIQARVPAKTWWALAAAPAYVVWKAWVQAQAAVKVLRGNPSFGPTPRD